MARGRLAAALITMVLVSATLGWGPALIWGVAQATAELALWHCALVALSGAPSRARYLAFIVATFADQCVWLSLSLLFWNTAAGGSEFASLIIWATLLVNALNCGFRSRLAFILQFTPVATALMLTPILAPRFVGSQQMMVACSTFILVGYAAISASRNLRTASELTLAREAMAREREAAQQADLAKSAFLATMSHEIRTPLNGVIGMAQAMERDPLPAMQRERLAVIRSGGETLLCLLNDMLDLSRIEAGRLELEDGVVDVAAIAASAGAAFTALAADKDIHLEVDVAPDAQGSWRGDPTRVRQVLYNLVANAVKFTARGSVRIRVRHEAGALQLSVSDTGPGIPAERLESLFEKFVQADASTTRQFGGSGLGLAICRELATIMGGSVSAESVEGRGSTFTLTLPAERSDPAKATPAPTRRAELDDCPGLRVLAAEDNPMNQQVLSTLLSQLGVTLVVVGDGAQAVEASATGDFDLILMDVQMPVMDGPTAARAIRARELPLGRRTPILALTANAMSHHAAEYAAAGMDGLVAKPIRLENLIAEIERVMGAADETMAIAV